jgi:hypothetical protein
MILFPSTLVVLMTQVEPKPYAFLGMVSSVAAVKKPLF